MYLKLGDDNGHLLCPLTQQGDCESHITDLSPERREVSLSLSFSICIMEHGPNELCFLVGGWAWIWNEDEMGEKVSTPCQGPQSPGNEGAHPGPHLLKLLQLSLRLCPLQLQVRQLAPRGLHLLAQGAALLPSLR